MPSRKRKPSRAQGAGLGLFFGALVIAALAQLLLREERATWAHQLPGWLGMAVGGFLLYRASKRAPAQPQPERPSRALEAGLLLAIVVVAAWVRLDGLKSYPFGGFRDEGENGNVGIQLMKGEVVDGTDQRFPVYIEHNTQNAAGYFYPVAVMFKLFGISITSVRYVSVFFGVLSVLAFWALCRDLFGPSLALYLAACLATLRWHVNFSRIGFLGIMTVFLSLPMLGLLLKGLREPAGPQTKKFRAPLFWIAVGLAVARGFLQFFGFQPGAAEAWVGLILGIPLLLYAFKAWGDPRSRTLMLSATALALAMYSYMAARLFVALVLAIVAHHLLTQEKPLPRRAAMAFIGSLLLAFFGLAVVVLGSAQAMPALKVLGKGLIGLGIVAQGLFWLSQRRVFEGWLRPLGLALGLGLVVAGPLYAYSLKNQKEVAARSYRVSIYNDEEADKRPWGTKLVENLGPTMGMVNVWGDGNPRHNLPGENMANYAWAALFALGVFYSLLNWRDPRAFMALALWQVSLVAGYLSIEAPQAYRCISAIPAVLLFMGLALERGITPLRQKLGDDAPFGVALLLLPLLLGGAYYELNTYFHRQPRHPGVWAEFSAGEYMMGQDLKALNQDGHRTHGLVRPDWADSYTFRFMTYPERDYEYFEVARHVPIRAPLSGSGEDFLYILSASYQPLAGVLKGLYPGGTYNERRHPLTNELLYWTYLVPAKEAAAAADLKSGLKGAYYVDVPTDANKPEDGPHWVKTLKRKDQIDPFILFDWTVSPVPGFFSAEWSGSLNAPKSGAYDFNLNSNSYGLLEIDGHKVCERPFQPPAADWVNGRVQLSAGRHHIRLRYFEARNYSRLELWWKKPGDADKSVVPSEALRPE
jgi:hypothetical protein